MKATQMKTPILVHPDFGKQFIIYTDTINLALWAILSQLDKNIQEHPVAYTSHVLNKHERN